MLSQDLATTWLLVEGGRAGGTVVTRRFCQACVPAGPVAEVACAVCADGPLVAGALAGTDPVADSAVAGWLVAQGWVLHPALTCPACRRAFSWASWS